MSLPPWKSELINLALEADALGFGSFKLKSGRISPYFVNCGRFSKGAIIKALPIAYAQTLHDYASAHSSFDFDVVFGPAYKGIVLAGATAGELWSLDKQRWKNVGYSYNRKEVKDHGEGGLMVGESLKGKKVVIIDDVITAGTAIREAIGMIKANGGELAGIIVAIDRQEKMPSQAEKEGGVDDGSPRSSAIGEVKRETGVPVLAVLTLDDIVQGVKQMGKGEEVEKMLEYRKQYGATD